MTTNKCWTCPNCRAQNVSLACNCTKVETESAEVRMERLNVIELVLPVRKARKVSK